MQAADPEPIFLLELDQETQSLQSPFSSDHSKYNPEEFSESSDSEDIPLTRLGRHLAPQNRLEGMQAFPEDFAKPKKRLLKPNEK